MEPWLPDLLGYTLNTLQYQGANSASPARVISMVTPSSAFNLISYEVHRNPIFGLPWYTNRSIPLSLTPHKLRVAETSG